MTSTACGPSSPTSTTGTPTLSTISTARLLGYYNADDVPVYDHLARQFAVCDRWFSSVPGATWPNRLYAICGRAADSRDDLPMNMPPLYNQPSFVRHLDAHDITWRWYSFEAGTLRMADAHYALGHHDRFAFFSKSGLNWKTALEVRIDTHAASFLEDSARGTLPSVSWIDPNFSNFNPIGFQPNDDHAPADIKDKPHHGLFARASAIRRPHYLGTRVAQAHDLGELLTRSAPRPAPDRVLLIDSTLTRAAVRPQDPPPGPDDPGGKPATDLQLRIAAAVRELRRRGHPADRP
jgi:hypothetical protein